MIIWEDNILDKRRVLCKILSILNASDERVGEGNGSLLQYSCLENPMNKGTWQAIVHEVTRIRPSLATKPPQRVGKGIIM